MTRPDDVALTIFRSSAIGRLWQRVVSLSYRAWLHSRARRWTLAGGAPVARDRVVSTASAVVVASLTALVLQQLAEPRQPGVWLVPAAALTLAGMVLAGCRTGRAH